MSVFKSAILELKTSKHLCDCIVCLVTCPKKYIQWSAYIWMCIWNVKCFIHSKRAGSPHKTLPWASEMVLAAWPVAHLYLVKGALGFQLFDCWGLMEYKTCEHCILLNLVFSFFVLSLQTDNSPNQTRQKGVRVWAEHFLAATYFSYEKAADCLQILKLSIPSLVHSASGRVGHLMEPFLSAQPHVVQLHFVCLLVFSL